MASTTPQTEKTLRIGYLGYLGGAQGLDSLHAIELLADMDNSAGGRTIGNENYDVKIVSYNNQNDQAMEVSAVQQDDLSR